MLYSVKLGDRIIIDKNLLLTVQSIGKPFSRVKGYFLPKIRRGDTLGRGMQIGERHF